jgi:AcrR family transcriptional regulator
MRNDVKSEEILNAAIRLIAEKGAAETTMREIAAAAGVREQTIYNNFETKDGIVSAIVGELEKFHEDYAYNRWNLARYRAMAEDGTSPVDAVLAFNILRFPEEKAQYYTDVYAVVLREQFNNPQVRASVVKLFFEDNYEYNRKMLTELHEHGYIDCDDPEMVARVYAETVYTYACGHILGYGEKSPHFKGPGMDKLLRCLLEIYIRPVAALNDESVSQSQSAYRRERIDALIDAVWERGEQTAVVTAAAGYGKTTAVQLYLEMAAKRDDAKIHWHQSSGKDSLGVRFWEGFCNNIDRTNPPLAARLAELGFPDSMDAFNIYLSIINTYMNKSHMHYLVFDNFQDATPNVRKFMERSIPRMPEKGRFIVD